MRSLWTRRSMIVFFLVGFGVPWVGWTTRALTGVEGPSKIALFYTGDFMTIAGFVATFVAAGLVGFRSLLRRYVQVKAPVGWALFALFIPLTWTVIPGLIYGVTHGGIGRFDITGLVPFIGPGLLALTTGPLGEEAGWRGYLQPRMLQRYSPLATSLIIGIIWSAWHYPLYYDSVFGSFGGAVYFTIGTLCFSILMTVLWAFTRASVFWAVIIHWTINITGPAVKSVFPDLHLPEGATDLWSAVVMVAVTALVYLWVGRERLDRKLEEAVGTLADECIEADRAG
jgi:membrane protease YdiL (CAAX protease family)